MKLTIRELTKLRYRAAILIRHAKASFHGYSRWRGDGRWLLNAKPTILGEPSINSNALKAYFDAHGEGPGIWKWDHYFEIYHRHLQQFRGREVKILEIGIYSGGSLRMWKEYFGAGCRIYGVDIEPSCKIYEDESISVFIGDQSDRNFWNRFLSEVGSVDVVIDDGSHVPSHQIASLEALLPHLSPGGVYICEDVHCSYNPFFSYVHGMAHNLNAFNQVEDNVESTNRRSVALASAIQSHVDSIHLYPYVVVIERRRAPVTELTSIKRGTKWEPFLK